MLCRYITPIVSPIYLHFDIRIATPDRKAVQRFSQMEQSVTGGFSYLLIVLLVYTFKT